MKKPDIQLWEEMQDGVKESLSDIFLRHFQHLYDYGVKICGKPEFVKDCVQEVFIYIWEKREKLSVPNSVRAYLLSALRRALLRKLQQVRKIETAQPDIESLSDTAFSPEEFIILKESKSEQIQQIRLAINALPVRMREALYLKTFDNLSYNEISQVMNISPQVARNYVFEALQKLRSLSTKLKNKG